MQSAGNGAKLDWNGLGTEKETEATLWRRSDKTGREKSRR